MGNTQSRRPCKIWPIWLPVFFLIFTPGSVAGQVPSSNPPEAPLSANAPAVKSHPLQDVDERFRRLEGRLDEMERATALPAQAGGFIRPESMSNITEVPTPENPMAPQPEATGEVWSGTGWRPRYDQGFILLDPEAVDGQPFQLKANVISQFRYTGFLPSEKTWTDSTGLTRPINERSNFDINRNYLSLSGFAYDPKLQFNATLLGSSASNSVAYNGWINYNFCKEFNLFGGYWKLPGSREWYQSYTVTQGVDRTMATTFFRPNLTPGVWAQGTLFDDLHYVSMIGNSLNSTTLNADRIGFGMAYAASAWWEPLGDFGPGFSDLEWHDNPAVRLGTSQTFANNSRQSQLNQSYPENTQTRLSNGTPLVDTGALAPGVTVLQYDSMLSAFDIGVKWRGMSLTGEYYLRRLDQFSTAGGISPFNSLFDHGGYVQAAAFIVPKKFELYARSSYVTGRFGTGSEVGGGMNWLPFGNSNVRGTLEVLRVLHSPADNILTPYRAGDTGTYIMAQFLTVF